MAAQVDTPPWPDSNGGLDDVLLEQLAAELGGNPAPAGPSHGSMTAKEQAFAANHYSTALQNAAMHTAGGPLGALPISLLQQSSSGFTQPMMVSFGGMHCDPQQLQNSTMAAGNFGSVPSDGGGGGPHPNSLNSANSMSYGPNSMMQAHGQSFLLYRPAFGGGNNAMLAAAAAAAGMVDAHPAASKSQSPSTSSGCHQANDDALEQSDMQRLGKTLNKGALAQKRFRERQKEKMRASEAQVAELTRRLGKLEMEKARLESRARLLEQVVSLNMIHEAKLHTNREIMVREQEMLLEDLAAFIIQLSAATHGPAGSPGSSTNSPEWLQMISSTAGIPQQQQQQGLQLAGLAMQHHQRQQSMDAQQDMLQLLHQQQQQQQPGGVAGEGGSGGGGGNARVSAQVSSLTQVIRGWTVQNMVDQVFPQYIACLQRLLPFISSSPDSSSGGSSAAAAAAPAQHQVEQLVLRRREMTDRHALFSHYYWAVWCFNRGDDMVQQLVPPTPHDWARVLAHLNLSKEQADAIVAARSSLLSELHRVAADWQRVLPTLALQLLQVPRAQWHTVGAVQAMVTNLAAEREAVVGFLHTLIDEVLSPVQEGQLEASSYPWCPDVWAIAGAAAAQAAGAQAAAAISNQQDGAGGAGGAGGSGGSGSGRGKGTRKGAQGQQQQKQQQQQQQAAAAAAQALQDEDPMAALSMGTDVLQPLMPFMTAFQLLREPVTAKGAGLRLKRALLLDPFRTVVPAAAYPQPTAAEVSAMSLLDAHCGTFQQVMLWDWLKANLPSYVTILGMQAHIPLAPAAPATSAPLMSAPNGMGALGLMAGGGMMHPGGGGGGGHGGMQHSMSAGNLAGTFM